MEIQFYSYQRRIRINALKILSGANSHRAVFHLADVYFQFHIFHQNTRIYFASYYHFGRNSTCTSMALFIFMFGKWKNETFRSCECKLILWTVKKEAIIFSLCRTCEGCWRLIVIRDTTISNFAREESFFISYVNTLTEFINFK